MIAPAIDATIERRILLNFRVDSDELAALLPAPFRPDTVGGYGIAGLCFLSLSAVRPARVPRRLGLRTENAAHRVAVQWDGPDGRPVRGVYILRRDTSSRLTVAAGGRLFPAWHHRATIETGGEGRVRVASADGLVRVALATRPAAAPMPGSVFASAGEAAHFFCDVHVAYAVTPEPNVLDGATLTTPAGAPFLPLAVDEVEANWFDGWGATLDSAFLMAGVTGRWAPVPSLRLPGPASDPMPWRPRPAVRGRTRAATPTS